jgi:adenosylcobinamide-GDP ribazoletransferase
MTVIKSVVLAFAMFSRIPMPRVEWTDRNRKYMICAFPLVGAVIGLVVLGWLWLCAALNFGALLRAAGLTVIPIALSGGIHLDGLCDTADALASNGSIERRRAILKDTHTGAFAVVWCACYIALYLAMCAEFVPDGAGAAILCATFILSRTLSALSLLHMRHSSGEGLAATFKRSADIPRARIILCVPLAACCYIMLSSDLAAGGAALAACALCLLWLRRIARRKFGGVSGDLAGWFLQICELGAVTALAVVPRVIEKLR